MDLGILVRWTMYVFPRGARTRWCRSRSFVVLAAWVVAAVLHVVVFLAWRLLVPLILVSLFMTELWVRTSRASLAEILWFVLSCLKLWLGVFLRHFSSCRPRSVFLWFLFPCPSLCSCLYCPRMVRILCSCVVISILLTTFGDLFPWLVLGNLRCLSFLRLGTMRSLWLNGLACIIQIGPLLLWHALRLYEHVTCLLTWMICLLAVLLIWIVTWINFGNSCTTNLNAHWSCWLFGIRFKLRI